jgi:hypothetical protein
MLETDTSYLGEVVIASASWVPLNRRFFTRLAVLANHSHSSWREEQRRVLRQRRAALPEQLPS